VATPASDEDAANPYDAQSTEDDPIADEMLGQPSQPGMWNRGQQSADPYGYGGGVMPGGPDTNLPSDGAMLAEPVLLEEAEVAGEKVVLQNILDEEKAEGTASEALAPATTGAPKTKFFNYAKVTDKGYWTIEIMDILLQYPGDKEPKRTEVCKSRPNGRCTAIVDTGTYLIYGPQDQVNNQLKDIVVNTCDDIKKLPKIIFEMYAGEGENPARLTLHPHDYTLEFQVPSGDGGETDCNKPEDAESDNCQSDCVLGLGPDNDEGWTLGQVFLRSFYTVFDRDKDMIGFIRANPRADIPEK